MFHLALIHLVWATALILWILAHAFNIWGSLLCDRHFRNRVRTKTTRERPFPQPISILKPIKGIDGNLETNLETFFHLAYVKFEILFSIADASDPAIPIVIRLLAKYPNVNARLIVENKSVGLNPKVNNLSVSYAEAKHDWLLISDSNVSVDPTYLFTVTELFTSDVGVVTAVVSGREPNGTGAWLEAVFLNTFYARWMLISRELGNPVVVGKSMLFRRSDAERFGGLKTLANYLAEDYISGVAMTHLNKRVEIMAQPIVQNLGTYSLSAFWSRHLRWGRIRKSQAPLVFAFEPLLTFWVSGIFGAMALHSMIGLSTWLLLSIHAGLWLASDLFIMRAMDAKLGPMSALAWLARETLYIPLWLHIAAGRSVQWRGRKLKLSSGGLLES